VLADLTDSELVSRQGLPYQPQSAGTLSTVRDPGSSGQLVEGCGARILVEASQPVSTGKIGNLFVRSDATCALYWKQHEKTKDMIQRHWIKTGDKYRVDKDGFYWFCGRSDDMLKVSGMWVSPVEIESTLVEHPAVLEAAVVGHADEAKLIKPRAYVVLRAGTAPSAETARELKEFVASRLASYKRPRWIEFVTELPKTATGKVQRFKLRYEK
jgi:acyl-coenzyme A synthetase/AMP-(fatty) acid ligase